MNWQDILNICYPLLNQNWITPLIWQWSFIQAINLWINQILSYKGYLWWWQTEVYELENISYWQEQIITLPYNILSIWAIYVYVNNERVKYDNNVKRYKKWIPILTEWISYFAFWNTLSIKIDNKNIKKVRIIYYRDIPHINTLQDEIKIPDQFKNVLVYFTMSEIIPVYHEFEQWRDINYYNKAVQMLEWLRQTDNSLNVDEVKWHIV